MYKSYKLKNILTYQSMPAEELSLYIDTHREYLNAVFDIRADSRFMTTLLQSPLTAQYLKECPAVVGLVANNQDVVDDILLSDDNYPEYLPRVSSSPAAVTSIAGTYLHDKIFSDTKYSDLYTPGSAEAVIRVLAMILHRPAMTDEYATFEDLAEDAEMMAVIADNKLAITTLSISEEGLAAIIASSTAMTTVVASSTAMTAIAANSAAMAAIIASSTAMTTVVASSTAMTAIAASSTAMMAIAASNTAMTTVFASATAKSAIWESAMAINTLTANSAAMEYLKSIATQKSTNTAIPTEYNLYAGKILVVEGWASIASSNSFLIITNQGGASGTGNYSQSATTYKIIIMRTFNNAFMHINQGSHTVYASIIIMDA